MNQKKRYEEANIELIFIANTDVISTSTVGGEGQYDKDGWA